MDAEAHEQAIAERDSWNLTEAKAKKKPGRGMLCRVSSLHESHAATDSMRSRLLDVISIVDSQGEFVAVADEFR